MNLAYTLWFNPRCSKCRQTLQLLQEQQIDPVLRLYLDKPPAVTEIKELLRQLEVPPLALVRSKDPTCIALGLSERSNVNEVAEALAAHPELLERPIFVHHDRAVIARPPERALELLGRGAPAP